MKENSLVLGELEPEELSLISDAESEEESVTLCLNCGTEVTDRFCPHCGQSVAVPKKLNNKTFGKSVAMSFARLNPGFLNTFIKLSYKPWEVVKDYIHGKQVAYSHPISMLIQLTLYTSFIFMIFEGLFDIKLSYSHQWEEGTHWFIGVLKDSTVVRVLWVSLPFIAAGYLVYWNHGSRRFTFSEYVIAALYLMISIRIYMFIFAPVNSLFYAGDEYSDFKVAVISLSGLTLGSIMVIKAFPIKNIWKRIGYYIMFLGVAFGFYIAYYMLFYYIDDLLIGKDMGNWIENFFNE